MLKGKLTYFNPILFCHRCKGIVGINHVLFSNLVLR
nr:MAG TPA: hypothetical protein [Caudoviricetes sp.]